MSIDAGGTNGGNDSSDSRANTRDGVTMKLACADQMLADVPMSVLAELGVKYVEMGLGALDSDAGAVRQWYAAAGLDVACVRLTAPLAPERYVDADDDLFAPVAALGVDTCTLPIVVNCDADQRREEQIAGIRRLGDLATGHGIRLAAELYESNQSNEWYADARAMCRLVGDVGHEAVGLAFDTGVYMRQHHTSSLDIALQRVLPHLAALRLGDHSSTPGDDRLLPLGDGVVLDGCRAGELLKTQRYAGPVVISVDAGTDGEEAVRTSVAYLRQCGWRIAR